MKHLNTFIGNSRSLKERQTDRQQKHTSLKDLGYPCVVRFQLHLKLSHFLIQFSQMSLNLSNKQTVPLVN